MAKKDNKNPNKNLSIADLIPKGLTQLNKSNNKPNNNSNKRPGRKSAKKPDDITTSSSAMIENILLESMRENIRARRWRIFFRLTYLAIFIFVFSLLALSIRDLSYTSLQEITGRPVGNTQSDHVALINIRGPVLGLYGSTRNSAVFYEAVADALEDSFDNENARAIVLAVNSPGGNPMTSSYIYNEIMKLREANPDKKVYAIIESLGASAAYHISAAADEIYAHEFSYVGSIGVIAQGFGFDQVLDDLGIERRLYTAGENKGMLDPFSPRNPAHEAHLEAILDTVHDSFIRDVVNGRGDRIDQEDDEIFSGLIFTANQALDLGLIDGIGFFDEIVEEQTGLDNIVDYSVYGDNPIQLLGLGSAADWGYGFAQGMSDSFRNIFGSSLPTN